LRWVDLDMLIDSPTQYAGTPEVHVQADGMYGSRGEYKTTTKILVNPDGQARVSMTANKLRIGVSGDSAQDTHIKTITARYQIPDRRYVRGVDIQTIRRPQ